MEVRAGLFGIFEVVDLPREHRVIGDIPVRGNCRGIFDFRHRKLKNQWIGFKNDHTRVEIRLADLIFPRDRTLDPVLLFKKRKFLHPIALPLF